MTAGGSTRVGARLDPEQAGIILDRLAGELLLAATENPPALAALRDDARRLLAILRPLLAERAADPAAAHITSVTDPSVVAVELRMLAERLLALAECSELEPPEDEAP